MTKLNLPNFDFINQAIPKIPPLDIGVPELKKVRLTIAAIKAMPDNELLAILNGESGLEGFVPLYLQLTINQELMTREIKRASKAHWSVTPQFWFSLVAAGSGCVAAYPVVFPPPQKPVFPIETHGLTKPDIHNSLSSFLSPPPPPKPKPLSTKPKVHAQPSIP
jgi:hypothetical protein